MEDLTLTEFTGRFYPPDQHPAVSVVLSLTAEQLLYLPLDDTADNLSSPLFLTSGRLDHIVSTNVHDYNASLNPIKRTAMTYCM